VTVIGTGYVGLVTGVCLADSGHDTVCVDLDADKVARLSSGQSTIFEPGIEELLASGLASGRLSFATPSEGWSDLLGDIVFVAVGTPMAENGAADLSQVRSAVSSVCEHAPGPLVIVMKSTVPPGTGAHLLDRFVGTATQDVSYVSNPEFLREGHAIEDWYQTDRIVLGGEPPAVAAVRELYESIDAPVVETDVASAEMIKYASNAFLTTKISFVNEIANVCDCVEADIDDVALGVGLDVRISPDFLRAGIGYGGSCFPKDTRALDFVSTLSGYQFDLLKAVIDVNNRQRLLPLIRLRQAIGDLTDLRVAILGLAFKPLTDDTRESPAYDIIPLLQEEGALVTAYDPVASPDSFPGVSRAATVWDALEGAGAVVLVTEWEEFTSLDWARASEVMSKPGIVFDGRNALDARAVTEAGLTYMAVGRPGAHRA
jgi:UDPglucose 6-dehydrogenase